ncbi:MAG: zf-TFIIB domain-containing protein [Kiritimatiellae bacterium]|nr:zf-TFIIB domain-containing protein [Kiritimatiellia bacterium]
MKCPDCKNELQPFDSKGIEINECVKCKGKWFDRDELRRAKDSADGDLRWLDFDPFGEDTEQLSVASEGKVCPRCSKKMLSLKYVDSKVVIDKCASCQGIWLDPGEFAKIIRYLEKKVCTETATEYVRDTFKQFIEVFTGRKGLISEVKDFLAVLYLLELRIAAQHPNLAKSSQQIYKSTPFQ